MPLDRDPVTYVDRTSSIISRYWNAFKAKCETLDGKELDDYKLATYSEIHFWLRDSYDIAFHQFVNRELLNYVKEGRKSGPELREHMKDLTRFILIDNIKNEFGNEYATLRDVNFARPKNLKDELYEIRESKTESAKKGEKRKRGRPSYKTLFRYMNEYYPELITKPTRFTRKLADDKRSPYETPFSSEETAAVYRDLEEMNEWASFGLSPVHIVEIDTFTEHAKQIQIVEPIDVMKFVIYAEDTREVTLEAIEDLAQELPDTDKIREYWLVKSLLHGGIVVKALFEQLRWLTQIRWFRERPKERQKEILWQKCELSYTQENAEIAVRESCKWYRDDGFLFGTIVGVTRSFNFYGRVDAGIMLYEECLKQMVLTDDDMGLLHHNLAIQFRLQNDIQQTTYHLKKSAEFYRKAKNIGAEAVEYGYLAEIHAQKEIMKYETYKEKAEGLLAELTDKKELAYYCLHLADSAYFFKDRKWEKILLQKGLRAIGDDPAVENYFLYMNQCLIDIENGLQERGPEDGLGRVPHPPEWKEYRISPFFSESRSSAPPKHRTV